MFPASPGVKTILIISQKSENAISIIEGEERKKGIGGRRTNDRESVHGTYFP